MSQLKNKDVKTSVILDPKIFKMMKIRVANLGISIKDYLSNLIVADCESRGKSGVKGDK